MENFTIDVYDAETGLVLKKTTIGENTYVEAEAAREFHVTLKVTDADLHKKQNPTVRKSTPPISSPFHSSTLTLIGSYTTIGPPEWHNIH